MNLKILICFILLLTYAYNVSSGWTYIACMSVCGAACVAPSATTGPMAPGAWSACMTMCAGPVCGITAIGCFSQDTNIIVLEDGLEKIKTIDQVHEKDVVK